MAGQALKQAGAPPTTRPRRLVWTALLAAGLLIGAGNFLFPYLADRDGLLAWTAFIAVPLAVWMAWLAGSPRRGISTAAHFVPLAFVAALAVSIAAQSWWPNSADEYGYVFLARTLLHGRLWNPPPPAPEIFEIAWTYVRQGKWFSQYPPAWPALLAPFLAAHIPWLLNPLLTAALAWLTGIAMRRLSVPREVAAPLTFLAVFSPFVLFNGASLFPHTLTAVLLMGIITLQAGEDRAPDARNRAGIGALFGILLLTRYDVFVLAAASFVIERLWVRRVAILRDGVMMAFGGLPFAAAFMLYNHAITGMFLKTPYAWASGGAHIGLWGKHVVFADAALDAAWRTAHWAGEMAAFTSVLLMVLGASAIGVKLISRRLRWFDVLAPAAIIFFFLYPATGGHEFGPRYWFFAWPAAILTIATGLRDEPAGWLRAGRWRVHAPTLAALHAPLFLGMCLSTAAFTHLYVSQRRAVEGAVPPHTPAIVLIPTRHLLLSRWQSVPITAHSADFCRNGVDLDKDILYARADNNFTHAAEFTRYACGFTGRRVYLWRAPGVMDEVDCR
jgi:hypothetical protein